MYRLWSKCVPVDLKRTPMTFKIKLTHNFGPLSITFSLKCLFPAKMAIFKVFGRIGYGEPKQFLSKWPRWFFLVHWNTFLPQSKQNSKLSFFAFLQVPMGVCGIFRPPVQGGSNELISKFLSSMILYNHPSYFKSGEINSCRLSPLPTPTLVRIPCRNPIVIIFRFRKEIRNNQMTLQKNCKIFYWYICVKDICQGFILPQNLDFKEWKLWTITLQIMKCSSFNAKKITMKNIKKYKTKH